MRARNRPEGAIVALSSSESTSAGVPGIGLAGASSRRSCRLVFVLALAVLAFAVLYPYMDATGSCGDPGCPDFSHSPAELPSAALVAVLAAVPALAGIVRLRSASDRKPVEIYLAPDPEPPRP